MPQDTAQESNPRAASTRIGSANAKTLAGQIRHDLRRGPQPAYVDAARTLLNRVLMEPLPPGQMRAICQERRALRNTQRAMKSNAAVATRGIITFGSEAAQMFERLTPDQQDAAFRELADAIAARLATSLHGLVVHMDEATIHAHYQLAAYNVHGNPIAKTTSPRILSELQDLTAEILARHCPGIERGRSYGERIAAGAAYADTIHKSVAELHRALPADLEAKRQRVAELAEAERAAAVRVEEMKDRVQKLEEKAGLSEKEVKRLATYEKRLADRLVELRAAQAASEVARVEADRFAELARADRQVEEERKDRIAAKATAVSTAVAALVEEMSDGTITRTPEGRIRAKAPERLKPGFPEVGPVVQVAADFVAGMAKLRDTAKREGLALGRDEAAAEVEELRAEVRELRGWAERVGTALSAPLRTLRDFIRTEVAAEAGLLSRARTMFGEGANLLKGVVELREALERRERGYRAGVLGEMQRQKDAPALAAYARAGASQRPTDRSAPEGLRQALDEPGLGR